MDAVSLERLLEEVRAGTKPVEDAVAQLRSVAVSGDGDIRVDLHRELRRGFPEVVYGEGKTTDQVVRAATTIWEHHEALLVTRVDGDTAKAVCEAIPGAEANAVARTVTARRGDAAEAVGRVAIVTAGTSDLPVAEEAAVTATVMGAHVESINDVGVSGVHRLLEQTPVLREASVVVVVAGMEGALPSVVAGLLDAPVIAVPTSVGYGASFEGLAALLAMLNSCASGVTVVNIDNGFGAGYAAATINRRTTTTQ